MHTIPGTRRFPHPGRRATGPFAAVLLLAIAGGPPARAQNPDLAREIQEIATRIDEQLQEIDRLLLDSGKKSQPREKPKDMLKQSHERSGEVEAGIDTLIQKLTEMKNQGGGGQSQNSDQQQQQDQQQQDQDQQGKQPKNQGQQGQRPRRDNQTPNFVQQPPQGQQQGQPQGQQPQPGEQQGEQPGQQPGQQKPPGQGNPLGGQDHQGPGENRTGNRQPEPDLGPGQAGQGEGSWGELPPYVNFMKNRGSAPTTVPAKYRKYWEAYLKSKPGGAAGNGGK